MAEFIYETFKLNNKCKLNNEDIRVLSLLYLPLMGIDSFALYSVLVSLEDGQVYSFKKLIDLLNFTNLKFINKALNKLQALGLLNHYYSESKGSLYELIAPLSFALFFENEMLASLLTTQIGETEVTKLYQPQKRIVGYKDRTKKFNEVYEVSSKSFTSTFQDLVKPNISVVNDDFNYTLFKLLFEENVISEAVLNDEDFKTRIHRISYTYKLNEEELKDVLIKTMDIDKNLEYSSISKNAKIAFQKKYKVTGPKIVTKTEDSFLPSSMDEKWHDIITKVDNMRIADTLQSLSDVKPSVSEIEMFDKLQQETGFPDGVINLMILHVNALQEGVLPGYNYFGKIANTWARAKIKNSYDVLKYFEQQNEKRNKAKTSTGRKKAEKPVPDWYDEYTKQLEGKATEKRDITDEEREELANLVKEIMS